MKKFTIPKAAEILGIEHNRLREFVSREYIKVTFPASGHGTKNYLTVLDFYEIKLFLYLLDRGFIRIQASTIVKFLYDYFRTELFEQSKQNLMFVCFKRAAADRTMKRKDIDRPYITEDGKIVSNKGLSPHVRIITEKDFEKSFKTLFMTFDDDKASDKYDFSQISFQDVLIINMKDIIKEVDRQVSIN